MSRTRPIAFCAALLGGLSGTAAALDCPQPPEVPDRDAVRRFGVRGDGRQDDTAALQAAIDATPARGMLYLPAGTYRIAVGRSPTAGLRLKSDMTLVMHDAAVLQAAPTEDGLSAVLKAWDVRNLAIFGGVLVGERHGHLGRTGEWGMGLDIRDATGVTVVGTTARDAWGDGFYLGGRSNADILLCGITAEGNRRNGLSIVAGRDVTVRASRFLRTAGTPPQAGVDIEPNERQVTERILVAESIASGNAGAGISLGASCMDCGAVNRDNTVRGNTIVDNRGHGIHVSFRGHTIEGNTIEGSGRSGILLWRAQEAIVRDNRVLRSAAGGLQLEGARGNRIAGNRLEQNPVGIILKSASTGNDLADNDCSGARPTDRSAQLRQDAGSTGNRLGADGRCR